MATLIGTKGNDHILGTPGEFNVIFGDPYTEGNLAGIDDNDQVLDAGRGGNDRLDGRGGAGNTIIGDAGLMSGTARGGNDQIFGGGDFNFLSGNSDSDMSGGARGGNDHIEGGDDFNFHHRRTWATICSTIAAAATTS